MYDSLFDSVDGNTTGIFKTLFWTSIRSGGE